MDSRHPQGDGLPSGAGQVPSAGAVAEARGWLLGELAGCREQVLDVLVATALDGRAAGDEADVGLLRAGMGEVFDLFVACAAGGRALTGDEAAFFQRLGAVRCGQGAELEVVAGEFRTAFDQCYGQLTRLAGDRPVAAVAAALAELTPALYRLRDDALVAIENGHARHARRLADSSTGPQAGLLRALLAGNPARLATEQARHGRADDQPAVLLLALGEPAMGAGRLQALLEPLLAAVPCATAAVIAHSPAPHLAVLAPTSDAPADLLATAQQQLAGRLRLYTLPAAPLHQLAEIYRQLAAHLQLADTLADSHGHICPHQLATYHLLATIPTGQAQQFITSTLAGLLARPEAQTKCWTDTLGAMTVEGGHMGQAATRRHCSTRTIRRHVAHIAELTGLDARQAGPRQQLALALGLWRLHRHRLPPPGDPAWNEATPPP